MYLENVIQAGGIILKEGPDGFLKATELVGYDMALGMIVASLCCKSSPTDSSLDEGNESSVSQILDQRGLLNRFVFSAHSGKALVLNVNGDPIHIILDAEPQEIPEGFHTLMWMQAGGFHQTIPAGVFPYTEAVKYLKAKHAAAKMVLYGELGEQGQHHDGSVEVFAKA